MISHRLSVVKVCTAIIAMTVAALGVTCALAIRQLDAERGEARAYVTLGQNALARGDRASAVLAFERASLLAPRAPFVRSALADTPRPTVGPPAARAFVGGLAPHEWYSLEVALGWITGLSLAVAIGLGPGGRGRLPRRLAIGSGVALVLSTVGVVESSLASRALSVVMEPTGALISPYESAGATADLHPGEVVVVGERYGDFIKVRGSDGVEGWMPSRLLQSVVGTRS